MTEAELRRVLGFEWGAVPHEVSRFIGDMNSETWEVRDGGSPPSAAPR